MEMLKATRLATLCVNNRMPVMFVGAPGVGKSDLATQIAAETSHDLLVSHPVVSDPTDAKGLPFADKSGEFARFLPYGDLARVLRSTKPLIWMLDDLGQALPAVQASFMQLLLARHIGEHRIPDHVTFIAATNRKADRAGVSGILAPVVSRFGEVIDIEPSVDAWSNWALVNGQPGILIAFLRFRKELLLSEKPADGIAKVHSPRTWAQLGKLINGGLLKPEYADLRLDGFTGAVGTVAATEFNEFLSVWQSMPSPDSVLLTPEKATIPEGLSALYALTSALASLANTENFGRIVTYAERLDSNGQGEMAAFLVRDSVRRTPALTGSAGYQKAATGQLGALFAPAN